MKQERVRGQYEQLIHTLEQENESLKGQKDKYGERLDLLTAEIDHLKKMMSEVLLTSQERKTTS